MQETSPVTASLPHCAPAALGFRPAEEGRLPRKQAAVPSLRKEAPQNRTAALLGEAWACQLSSRMTPSSEH